jgi:hypothetical protein
MKRIVKLTESDLIELISRVIKEKEKEGDDEISEYSRTLKNARRQGVGLRFPKSAIKSNPMRFRPYNR